MSIWINYYQTHYTNVEHPTLNIYKKIAIYFLIYPMNSDNFEYEYKFFFYSDRQTHSSILLNL